MTSNQVNPIVDIATSDERESLAYNYPQDTNTSFEDIAPITSTTTSTSHDVSSSRMTKKPSRCFTITYYITLSAVAIFLTINVKGSMLWKTNSKFSSDRGDVVIDEILSLVIHYVAVLIALFCVQGSDPGYLTSDVMENVCEQDGLSLLGENFREPNDIQIEEGFEKNITKYNQLSIQNEEEDANRGFVKQEINLYEHVASTIEMTAMVGNREISRRNNKVSTQDQNANPMSLNKRRRKICTVCNIAPPLRSHHCKHCSKCVATFDHHCAFIGTCIGERNHCRFYLFIVIQAFGFKKCTSIINSSSLGIVSFLKPILYKDVKHFDIWMVVVAKVYIYSLSIAAWMIVCIHTWFVLTNGTTFEAEKGEHLEYLNGSSICDLPYSRGLCSNLKLFCCVRDSSSKCCSGSPKKDIPWTPILWKPIGELDSNSVDWKNNLWSNRYWSCC